MKLNNDIRTTLIGVAIMVVWIGSIIAGKLVPEIKELIGELAGIIVPSLIGLLAMYCNKKDVPPTPPNA